MGEYQYMIAGWPRRSQELAKDVAVKYGSPHAVAESSLEWNNRGDFRRMLVRKDGVLEQVVYYQVPQNRLSAVAAFGDRLRVDVDEHEVTAIAENEDMNLLMLNLMHDVMIGEKTPLEAWQAHDRAMERLKMSWPEPYTQGLHFHTDEEQLDI